VVVTFLREATVVAMLAGSVLAVCRAWVNHQRVSTFWPRMAVAASRAWVAAAMASSMSRRSTPFAWETTIFTPPTRRRPLQQPVLQAERARTRRMPGRVTCSLPAGRRCRSRSTRLRQHRTRRHSRALSDRRP